MNMRIIALAAMWFLTPVQADDCCGGGSAGPTVRGILEGTITKPVKISVLDDNSNVIKSETIHPTTYYGSGGRLEEE